MKKITIAIDGYSSTGKSTIAKQLAKHLSYVYVDSGAMYRAVALYALQNRLYVNQVLNIPNLLAALPNIKLHFKFNSKTSLSEIYLNNKPIEKQIRTMEISNLVSQVARIPQVRKQLVELQKNMGANKGIVMDGRDIGTVVFPDAELKLFLTASATTRAKRRYKELATQDPNISLDAVFDNITSRDEMDTSRKDSPLIRAKDAIEIDNSFLSKEAQFELILSYISRLISD